jgi:hypothetical protein
MAPHGLRVQQPQPRRAPGLLGLIGIGLFDGSHIDHGGCSGEESRREARELRRGKASGQGGTEAEEDRTPVARGGWRGVHIPGASRLALARVGQMELSTRRLKRRGQRVEKPYQSLSHVREGRLGRWVRSRGPRRGLCSTSSLYETASARRNARPPSIHRAVVQAAIVPGFGATRASAAWPVRRPWRPPLHALGGTRGR